MRRQAQIATAATTACNLCQAPVPDAQSALWHKDGFDIVRCPNCGLLFRHSLPTPQELDAIYSETYFHRAEDDTSAQGYDDYLEEEELHRVNAAVRLHRLGAFVEPGRLFDVGAAAGFFMDEARRAAWLVEGIDISPEMSGWGRDRLGLNLLTGRFREADLSDRAYDCVTMWDYIEHS